MSKPPRFPLLPVATFLVAVAAALASSARPAAGSLRPAGMATSSCDHTKYLKPSETHATTRTVDGGVPGLFGPDAADFLATPPAAYTGTLTSLTQTRDGSVALHVGRKGGEDTNGSAFTDRVSLTGLNSAQSGFKLSSGTPADCCHDIRFVNHGFFQARLAVKGPIQLGSSGTAILGGAAPGGGDSPISIETDLRFDVTCNGVPDSLYNRVRADVRLSAAGRAPGRPPFAIFVGFQEGLIQEITDGTGIQTGPRRTFYLSYGNLPDPDGVEETISRPFGFTNQPKKFREESRNWFQVISDASVRVSRVVRFRDYPTAEVDLSIDVTKHFSEDETEGEQAEIE